MQISSKQSGLDEMLKVTTSYSKKKVYILARKHVALSQNE